MSRNLILFIYLVPYMLSSEIQYGNPKVDGLRLVAVKGKGHPVYVVKAGVKHKVPNPKTLFYLGEDLGDVKVISDDELKTIPTGSTYPSWEPKQKLKKKHESKFIRESKRVSSTIVNAAIANWRGKYIACFRVFVPHPKRDIAFSFTMDHIACQWLTDTFDLVGESALVRTSYSLLPSSSYLVGEDPRLHVTLSGSLVVYYNRINVTEFQHRRMLFCELQDLVSVTSVSVSTRSDQTQAPELLAGPIRALNYEDKGGPRHQKNWTPFTYSNQTFFVYSVFPLHRVLTSLSPVGSTSAPASSAINVVLTKTVALTRARNTSEWNFGEIRGGSPPIWTPAGYLSFFHSSSRGHSSRWWAMSYFMGAYLFTLEPPFAVIKMSREPIVAKQFYTGKWASSHTDYVPFPTSAFLSGDEVVVACGLHDREAWVVRMSWAGLVHSLVPVQSDVLLNSLSPEYKPSLD